MPETPGVGGCGDSVCDPTAHVVPQVFASPGSPLLAERIQIGWVAGCALNLGAVTCWGNDAYKQAGLGAQSSGAAHFDPTPLAGIPAAKQLSMRGLTTLVLDGAASVWALGWNDEGQVGDGTFGGVDCGGGQKCVDAAKQVPGLSNVTGIFAGFNNSAAITSDGKVWVWGSNYTGALAHVPGSEGDVLCPANAGLPCNSTPHVVKELP